jgi:rare lipoprotein A
LRPASEAEGSTLEDVALNENGPPQPMNNTLRAGARACAIALACSLAPLAAGEAVAQSGMASYYGGHHHGRRTASGERFNMNAMTAAHRSLPFGTRLRVTDTRSGRNVVVRINDRGPFIRGRVVDLSVAAARSLGMMGSGVAPVRLERVASN